MSRFLTKLSKDGTARHCQSKETSILWSHHEETMEFLGERDNARNNARCTQVRKTTHGLDGHIKTWTGLHVEESIRMTEITGESIYMVWPTLGSRTAKEQRSYSTPGLVSTGMGDRIGVQLLVREIYLSLTNHQVNSAWPSLRE